jgi:hypothetical protein
MQMDFFDFLSKIENYKALVAAGKYTIKNIYSNHPEDVEDIISEALENLLDYFKRKPEKLLEIQRKEKDEMSNYLKKSMRNHVINILKKRNRIKKSNLELMENLTKSGVHYNNWFKGEYQNQEKPSPFVEEVQEDFAGFIADRQNFSLPNLKKHIYHFIEEKYRQESWSYKKSTIDIFFERFEKHMTLQKLKAIYPNKNIPSFNTEANRILKKYLHWVEKRGAFHLYDEKK